MVAALHLPRHLLLIWRLPRYDVRCQINLWPLRFSIETCPYVFSLYAYLPASKVNIGEEWDAGTDADTMRAIELSLEKPCRFSSSSSNAQTTEVDSSCGFNLLF